MVRDELAALSILHKRVVRAAAVDPRSQPGFTSDHSAMLKDIDGTATVLELISNWGRPGAERALAALRQLHAWGACTLAEDSPRAAAPAAPADPLLAEQVDLDDPTKRRILAATTMLREGQILKLLGVGRGAGRTDLKRAYYALAKEFHPDRFYGKQLGSYARLLSQIFETASQAIKTLVDQRTVTPDETGGGQQRRRTPRYPFQAKLRMRCESWGHTMHLATREVGAGGMFVTTDQNAQIGERAAFEIALPDRTVLHLDGRIVDRVEASDARPAGLCVQFSQMSDQDRLRLEVLLEAARAGSPTPATGAVEPVAPRSRLARGSDRVRTVTPVVGIDLGTTFVSVSAAIDGRVYVLPFAHGDRAIPSVVAFPRRGEVVVGEAARARLARDPQHAIASAKRLLGRRADDKEIQGQVASAGYPTFAGASGELMIDMWGEPMAVPQICGYLLDAARQAAEAALGRPVGSAVLTAPVSFGADKIELLRRAARQAHLEVIGIVDEPSAAAVANRFRPEGNRGLVGIYDFGGGTFDFSVVDTSGGDFRVITTAGDSWLGGDDFDTALAEALANLFWRSSGVDLRLRAVEWQNLLFAVERAKRALSSTEETQLVVRDVLRTASGSEDLTARILRPQVEKIWRPLIDRSLNTCLQTLTIAGLKPTDLSAVYLSGGTTHIPLVKKALEQYFGTPPIVGVPPDYAVCLGAGVQAAQMEQLREPTLKAQ